MLTLFGFPQPLFYDPFATMDYLLRSDPFYALLHPQQQSQQQTQQQPQQTQQQPQQQTQQPQQQPQQQTQQTTKHQPEYQYYYYHSTEKHANGHIEVHETTRENGEEKTVHTQKIGNSVKKTETHRDTTGSERTTEQLINIPNKDEFEKEWKQYQKNLKALN